jgi:hypothetical protein
LTEFHALLHPPLLEHENIIHLLGLAWGNNDADPLHQLPILIVEYGNLGTLSDVQKKQTLTSALKANICLGIARGLNALHSSGIIHGDVKPDNIIMCSGEGKIMVPKLADFGFAIIASSEAPNVVIGGTRTWRAPESDWAIPAAKLNLTDIYSFGLVVWSVVIDGENPFSLMIPHTLLGEARLKRVDSLKAADKVISLSKLENWAPSWALQRLPREFARPKAHVVGLSPTIPSSFPLFEGESTTDLCRELSSEPLFQNLNALFSLAWGKDPNGRDLCAVIQILEDCEHIYMTRRGHSTRKGMTHKPSDVHNLGHGGSASDLGTTQVPPAQYAPHELHLKGLEPPRYEEKQHIS